MSLTPAQAGGSYNEASVSFFHEPNARSRRVAAAWDRLKACLLAVFERAGADCFAGRQVYRLLVEAGLEDVAFRPCQAGARSTDPLADFLPSTVLSTKSLILRYGLASEVELDTLIAGCRRHLAEPTTIQTSVIAIQAWGRKPSGLP